MNKNDLFTIAFTGMRPGKLWGYDLKNINYTKLIKRLEVLILDIIKDKGKVKFIAGGALGFDTIAAITVIRLKTNYHVDCELEIAVPYEEQYTIWNKSDQKLYHSILNRADIVTYVDSLDYYKCGKFPIGKYTKIKLQTRNMYMVDGSDFIIGLHDGSSGGTKNAISYAEKYNKKILIISPKEIENN